jgi:hypothetical protein
MDKKYTEGAGGVGFSGLKDKPDPDGQPYLTMPYKSGFTFPAIIVSDPCSFEPDPDPSSILS